jgi:hypothetical protein
MSDTGILCISYVPFITKHAALGKLNYFDVKDGKIPTAVEGCLSKISEFSAVKACVWVNRSDSIAPTFLVKKAGELFDDILVWSEGVPKNMFTLDIVTDDDGYCISLVPNLEQSINRFKLNYMLTKGKQLPDNATFRTMFHPISVVSSIGTNFQKFLEELGDTCSVGMVQFGKFHSDNMHLIGDDDILFINDLPVRRESESLAYKILRQQISDFREYGGPDPSCATPARFIEEHTGHN